MSEPMASFHYKAMTSSGAIVRGVIEAPSEAALVQQLRRQGQFPISTSQSGASGLMAWLAPLLPSQRQRAGLAKLRTATEELAALLQAGLELDRALGILTRLSEIGALKEPFARARDRVRDGASLGDALAQEEAFPPFYIAMVRAGEFGGTLGATLKSVANYLGRSIAIRESVGSALVYPAILLVSAAVSVGVIVLFVLPEFKPLFAEAGKELPLPTRIAMGLGDAIRGWWWLFVIAGAGLWFWVRSAIAKPVTRLALDRRLLGLPLIGRLIADAETERFSRTLGTLLSNGVALPSALALTKDVLSNRAMANAIAETAKGLREGDNLARRLSDSKLFPAVTLDLIQIGEETGKLPEMLLRQAELDEQRLRHTIDRLMSLLVPALTIVLGMIVAGVIASMLIAILSVNDLALQ